MSLAERITVTAVAVGALWVGSGFAVIVARTVGYRRRPYKTTTRSTQ